MGKEIKILITLRSKFVSVNSLYNARVQYKMGKPIAVIYKNPDANRVESEVRNQLLAVDFSEYIDWLKSTKQFDLNLKFILKKNASHKDSSNLIKNIEDIWTRFVVNDLGISEYDDSMHVKVVAEKSLIPGADHEYCILILKEHKGNIRYDIEPQPEKIWISGWTKDEITAFLPPLPKRLKKKEHYLFSADYEEADTKIHILQPQEFISLGRTKIAEIYRDLVEAAYSGFGFVIISIIGEESAWDRESWESLEWLKKEVERLKSDAPGLRFGCIKSKEEILEWIK